MASMSTDGLIQKLCEWVRGLPNPKDEKELHNHVFEKLNELGQEPKNKPLIENPGANGKSIPDIIVASVNPNLLIEFKVNGGWECVSQAAWQLFQASELLKAEGRSTRKLAIFGSHFSDPLLPEFLKSLDVEWGHAGNL